MPIIEKLENLTREYGIDVGGFEIVIDESGDPYIIDMNCVNTNYNTTAEKKEDMENYGVIHVVNFLENKLKQNIHTIYK